MISTTIEAILGLATICTHTHCNEQRQQEEQVCADCYGLTSEFCSSQGGHCQYRQAPKAHDKKRCENPEEDDDHDRTEEDDDHDRRHASRETVAERQSNTRNNGKVKDPQTMPANMPSGCMNMCIMAG